MLVIYGLESERTLVIENGFGPEQSQHTGDGFRKGCGTGKFEDGMTVPVPTFYLIMVSVPVSVPAPGHIYAYTYTYMCMCL